MSVYVLANPWRFLVVLESGRRSAKSPMEDFKKETTKKNDLMKNFTCRRIVSSLSFLSLHICHNPPLSLFYTLSQPLFRCCTDNHTHTYIPAGHGRNNNPARQVEYIGRHHWLFSSSSSSSLLFLCVGNPFGTFE